MGAMAPPAGARCSTHPETSAVDTCQRCGRFICGTCANVRKEDVYCTECTPRIEAEPRPTSSWALVFALAPIPLVYGYRLVPRLAVPAAVGVFCIVLAPLAFAASARLLSRRPQRRGFKYWLTWMLQAINFAGLIVQLL